MRRKEKERDKRKKKREKISYGERIGLWCGGTGGWNEWVE